MRGVTGLLGGPVGLIVTLALFSGEIKRGTSAVTEWVMGFTEAGRQLKKFEEEQKKSEQATRNQVEAAKEHAASLVRQNELYEQARNKTSS